MFLLGRTILGIYLFMKFRECSYKLYDIYQNISSPARYTCTLSIIKTDEPPPVTRNLAPETQFKGGRPDDLTLREVGSRVHSCETEISGVYPLGHAQTL